jgi:RNA polymerase sigma-32 factor
MASRKPRQRRSTPKAPLPAPAAEVLSPPHVPPGAQVVDAEFRPAPEDVAPAPAAPQVKARAGKGRAAKAPAAPTPGAEAPPPEPEVEAEAEGEPAELGVEPAPEELEDIAVDDHTVALARPASAGALGRGDPLSAYMREVSRHPLLDREEELRLARRFRDQGDVKAAYRLVASNLRLVVKLAHEYHRNPLSLLDLVQEGNIGLMQAVKKFDPERGVKLSSYAAWWIRAYILRYIMDNWKMVKLGTTEAQRKLFFKLRQEQERLVRQGIEATPKLLADRLNVSEQDVVEMDQRLRQDEVSLDAPVSVDDDSQTKGDRLLPTNAPAADDTLGDAQLKALFREKLSEFAAGLNEKERYLFDKRLIADEPLTLQDIGTHWGVSRERARQIEASLVARMKKYMREHITDFDLVSEEGQD